MNSFLRRRRGVRGAALTEFALMAPILVIMLLFSMYFTEVVRAKLKLQEAARYAAWEMTSYTLTDYGASNHTNAFNTARDETLLELKDRFQDLDSIDNQTPGNFMVGYSGFDAKMTNNDVQAFGNPLPSIGGGTGTFLDNIAGALSGAIDPLHRHFGFSTKGKVQVEVTASLDNRILPRHFLDDGKGFFKADPMGGSNLQNLKLRNKFTLIADGWNLPDGADAVIDTGGNRRRAGNHRGGGPSGLYTQVHRMVFFGGSAAVGSIPGLGAALNVLGGILPNPFGTFVVSHNYGLEAGNNRDCTEDPGLDAFVRTSATPGTTLGAGRDGMNNVQKAPALDHERRRCYDTAPFRDHKGFASNQYMKIFYARGPHFLGCQQAQADDPTVPGRPPNPQNKDKNTKVVECEAGVQ